MDQMAHADDVGDLNDFRYFAAVVDAGGFSAASRLLGLPKSRLSRRVAALEARLGVRLLQRSTRRLTLTEVGRQVLGHAHTVLAGAGAAWNVARQRSAEPAGRLRLSAPAGVLDRNVTGVLVDLLQRYPRLQLDVVVTNHRVNLIDEGIDVALRVRADDDEDPQWATRRLRAAQGALVASPALLQQIGPIDSIDALSAAPALGALSTDGRVHWSLRGPDGQVRQVTATLRLGCEHFPARLQAALAGVGVTLLPLPYAADALQDGRLVQVLPGWSAVGGHLQAVYATQRGLLPGVRALIDALVAMPDEAVPRC
jgi:DNA-binding transcriptional LysR family regulator